MARGSQPAFDRAGKVTIAHPYACLWEPLQTDPTFVLRPMFGTKAAYVAGKLVLCFSARKDPWGGILIATDHPHHASLQQQFPNLIPHSILPKWLYLPDSDSHFESTAERLVALVRQRDVRIGIEPKARKRRVKRAK